MHDNAIFASRQSSLALDESNSFSHYLSFRFYKDNLDHLGTATKDSINNFLKSISEIEDDFLLMMQQQQITNLELHDFGLGTTAASYMEENY
jgi:hypothetical protein